MINKAMGLREDFSLSFPFLLSRKIKESLECFPVKLNNLIHTLAQMPALSLAKPAPQTLLQESCILNKTRTIQRVTILGFSKTHSNVSLNLSVPPALLHILFKA
jgi:phosphatidylinositol-4-phosphate 3-kinase